MLKKEGIYMQILEEYFASKKTRFTQKHIAEKMHVSLGMVNKTVSSLERVGAVERVGRGFVLVDAKKLLAIFCTSRNLEKDIIFSTKYQGGAGEIETLMPNNVCFTAYSAYRLRYNDAPSDYDKVFVYSSKPIARFPKKTGIPNVFVLSKPDFLAAKIAPASLMYADLWNMKDWFASEYLKALERRLFHA